MHGRREKSLEADLDSLIDEIIVDAYGEDEQLWAFRQVLEDEVELPADAFVIGEPVSVIKIDYEGNPVRGLQAVCRKQDGDEHVVAFADVLFFGGTEGARYHAAYRRWLGLEPAAYVRQRKLQKPKRHKAVDNDINADRPVELVVLSVKKQAGRCQLLGTGRELTLRCRDIWNQVPGEIIEGVPDGFRPHIRRIADLAFESVSARKSRELGRIFSQVLAEAQEEGIALVIYERQQTVYHLTVARVMESG